MWLLCFEFLDTRPLEGSYGIPFLCATVKAGEARYYSRELMSILRATDASSLIYRNPYCRNKISVASSLWVVRTAPLRSKRHGPLR